MGNLTHVSGITASAAVSGMLSRLERAGLGYNEVQPQVDALMKEWLRLDAWAGMALDKTADEMDVDRTVVYFIAAHAFLVEVHCA